MLRTDKACTCNLRSHVNKHVIWGFVIYFPWSVYYFFTRRRQEAATSFSAAGWKLTLFARRAKILFFLVQEFFSLIKLIFSVWDCTNVGFSMVSPILVLPMEHRQCVQFSQSLRLANYLLTIFKKLWSFFFHIWTDTHVHENILHNF